jgi:hypothetical protein
MMFVAAPIRILETRTQWPPHGPARDTVAARRALMFAKFGIQIETDTVIVYYFKYRSKN